MIENVGPIRRFLTWIFFLVVYGRPNVYTQFIVHAAKFERVAFHSARLISFQAQQLYSGYNDMSMGPSGQVERILHELPEDYRPHRAKI